MSRSTLLLALLGLALAPLSAGASLIGDTVSVRRGYDAGSGFVELESHDILVAAGPSDATLVGGNAIYPHTFDAEANSFTLSQVSTGWGTGFVFNGYRIESLDWIGDPTAFLSGIEFTTAIPGLTGDRVTFGDHEVAIDFSGLSVAGSIIVQLTPTPEPGTALLLGGVLLALAVARRVQRTSS